MIDAGTPGDWSYFRRSLAALGGSLTDHDAVLLTHAHPAHIGFAERARAQAAARVWVHQGDAEAAKTGAPKQTAVAANEVRRRPAGPAVPVTSGL